MAEGTFAISGSTYPSDCAKGGRDEILGDHIIQNKDQLISVLNMFKSRYPISILSTGRLKSEAIIPVALCTAKGIRYALGAVAVPHRRSTTRHYDVISLGTERSAA